MARTLLLSIILLLGIGLQSHAQFTWKAGVVGNWNDADNWVEGDIPTAGSDIVIPSGTVRVNTTPNPAIGGLTMTGGMLELFAGLSLTINGSSNIGTGATLEVRGTLTLNDNLIVDGQLILEDGGIFGPGDLSIKGDFNWNGAAIEVSGQFVNTGTIDIMSAQLRTILDNQGTVNQTGDLILGTGGKYINNNMHDFQNNADINENVSGTLADAFTNNGTLIKSGGDSPGRSDILVVYDGTGSVEAQTGSIEFRENSTQSGTLISSGGSIRFPTSTHSFSGVSIQGAGFTEVNGATVTIDSDVSATNFKLDGGQVSGTANLTVTNSMFWMSGTFGNSTDTGQITLSGTLTIDGPSGKTLGTTLTNNGTATWIDGDWILQSGAFLINGGEFDIQTSHDMGLEGMIQNNGTLTKSGGATATTLRSEFRNTGTVSIETSTLEFRNGSNTGTITVNAGATFGIDGSNSVFTNEASGTIGGSGSIEIEGSLVNNGAFAPGASPGILTVNGNLTMNPTSTIEMEIGGTGVGTEHDQINFTGNVSMDGKMNISFINGFRPEHNDSFTLFTSPVNSGALNQVSVESQDGLGFTVNNASSVVSIAALSLNDYHHESIPYEKTTLESPISIQMSPDDDPENVPIGFDFNFFGKVENEVSISQNGSLIFGSGDLGEAQLIPNDSDPNNFIAGFASNFKQHPFGKISYSLNGTAPNRQFIVDYDKLSSEKNIGEFSLQIKLFEGSSNIEIHCEDCPEGISNNTQGIENGDGTKAFFVNGRNRQEFGLSNDGVSFAPFAATPTSQTEVTLNFPPLVIPGTIRRTKSGGDFSEIATSIAIGTSSFMDTGLDAFTEYIYELTGAFGPGEASSTVFYLKTKTLTDSFVDFVEVSTSSTSVNLNWTNNTLGSDNTRLERATSADGPFQSIITDEVERPFGDGNLDPSITYYYRVGAATSFGHAAFSSVLMINTDPPNRFFVNQSATGANDGSSWENAYTELFEALNVTSSQDEVWVAAGTYKPGVPGGGDDPSSSSTFEVREGVKLYGGFAGSESSLEERDIDANPTMLSGDIGIEGDASDNVRTVVTVSGAGAPLIDGLTIRDGFGGSEGGGIFLEESNLTISNSIIKENQTTSNGGGIYMSGEGTLKISDSEIIDNTTSETGGGIYFEQEGGAFTTEFNNVTITGNTVTKSDGGGIYYVAEFGTLKIVDSKISNNQINGDFNRGGGGIYIGGGKLSLTNSEVNGNSTESSGGGVFAESLIEMIIENTQIDNNEAGKNQTTGRGGAIYLDNPAFTESPLVIINSTISNNTAPNNGGGLFSSLKENDIVNSTFSGNESIQGNGGGLYFDFEPVGVEPHIRLNHVTITNNSADGRSGGGIFNSGSIIGIRNVLLAGNTDSGGTPDFSGDLTSNGNNIIGDLGASIFSSNTTGDKYGDTQATTIENAGAEESTTVIDPMLGLLSDNFGTTQTHALTIGGPAIDMGTVLEFDGKTFDKDQRGFPLKDTPDIGAFEFNNNFAPVLDNSSDLQFTTIDEDPIENLLLGDLLTDLDISITDMDGLNAGIAVVGSDSENGGWQFSLNNGATWVAFVPTIETAWLLPRDATTRVRFVPNANFSGTVNPGITFHAWDQSQGEAGNTFDASTTDGESPFSADSETASILVNAINDAPVLTNAIADLQINEDEAFNLSISNVFVEVDAGDAIQLTASLGDHSALPSWLSFNGTTFSGTPSNADVSSLTIKVTATDEQEGVNTDEFQLEVVNVNDAPVLINAIVNQTGTEDQMYSFAVPTNTFNDIDAGDALTLIASLSDDSMLPTWLSFDGTTFSGIPTNDHVGSFTIKVTATDNAAATATDEFLFEVNNVNDVPVVANPIADQDPLEDIAYSFMIPDNAFEDVDAEDVLTLTASLTDDSALPSWLTFDGITFAGTPTNEDVGSLTIKVTATDNAMATVVDEFILEVVNANDAPIVTNPIGNQDLLEDLVYSFMIPENTFDDVDAGDVLALTVSLTDGSALPPWLTFDGAIFSGTPTNEDVGTLMIKLTATDNASTSVTDEFVLEIVNVNDPPTVANIIMDQITPEADTYSFSVSENTFNDEDAGDALTLTASLADDSSLPAWLSFDGTTFSGTPTHLNVATIRIKVIATDQESASVSTEFDLLIDAVTGIEDVRFDKTLSVFPNPTHGKFNISLLLSGNGLVTLRVINGIGKVVFSESNIEHQEFKKSIDLSHLPYGVYYLSIVANGVFASRKIIKR